MVEVDSPKRVQPANNVFDTHCRFALGSRSVLQAKLTLAEKTCVLAELTRQREFETHYAPGERLTWRREHLSQAEIATIEQPRVDELLLGVTNAASSELNSGGLPKRWPEGRSFAVCATHDMDHVTAYGIREKWRRYWLMFRQCKAGRLQGAIAALRSPIGVLVRKHIQRIPDKYAQVAACLKMEADLGFKSTLYFFASDVDSYHKNDCFYCFGDRTQLDGVEMTVGEMIREVERSGWEVGLHGSIHSATVPGMLARQKANLEQLIGTAVMTTRQHFLEYDVRRTPALQAEAGFLADSTQGFNDLVGFRAGTAFPYLCYDWNAKCSLPIVELPLSIQDGALFSQNSSMEAAIAKGVSIMDRVERVGGALVLLWHPVWFATDVGMHVYRGLLEEARRRNAWACTARQLAEWWFKRSA